MDFWDRLFSGRKPPSKEIAKERLQVLLVYERARIEPGVLVMIRDEIINSISKHVDIDKNQVQLSLTHDEGQSRLVANIPLGPSTRLTAGRREPATTSPKG